MVNFLIGHYTYIMFPPAIDIISASLPVAYSDGKCTNKKLKRHHVTYSPTSSVIPASDGQPWNQEFQKLTRGRWRNGLWKHSVSIMSYWEIYHYTMECSHRPLIEYLS